MAGQVSSELSFRFVEANGIRLHIAEQGSGQLVLLIHGFPAFWYSWRHQIPVLAEAGYHVVAPDLRGFGKSDSPEGADKYTQLHVVGDLIGLLDVLGEKQAFVVGHDWGAVVACNMCLFRPDRVKAVVALSVPFKPRSLGPVEAIKRALGEGFYMCRFQEPGRAEADFAREGFARVFKKFLCYSRRDLLICPPDKEIMEIVEEPNDLPPWISEQEIQQYAEQYEKTGFTGGLNYYRAIDLHCQLDPEGVGGNKTRSWELMAPWSHAKVVTPAYFIAASEDIVYALPGTKEYVATGMKEYVPNLHGIAVLEGLHHFMHEENPDVVNNHILNFLGKFSKD